MPTVEDNPALAQMQRSLATRGMDIELSNLERSAPYEPQGGSAGMFYSRAKEILLEGPAGTGKSRGVLEKIHFCMQKYPRSRGLIVRKTRESIAESVLVTLERHVFAEADAYLADGPNRHNRQVYYYRNGAELVVGGLDKSSRIMSTEFDMLYVNEATEITLDEWEYLLTRLRNHVMPYQQAIADCNPDQPFHWLNQRPAERRIEPDGSDGGPKMERFFTRHKDNPVLWHAGKRQWTQRGEEYMSVLRGLTGARRLRLYDGKWAAAEGAVYEEVWDPSKHEIDPLADMRVIRYWFASLDWGYQNPGVVLVWAVDNDNRMYCVHQIYRRHKTVSGWWIPRLLELRDQYPIDAIVPDPSEPGYIDEMRKAGLPVAEANNDVTLGIHAVEERLRIAGNGRASLYFFKGNLKERDEELVEARLPWSTEQEFAVYSYPKGVDGKPIKEEPIKLNDHGMDAVRYGVMYADQRGPTAWQPGSVRVESAGPRPRRRRRRRISNKPPGVERYR